MTEGIGQNMGQFSGKTYKRITDAYGNSPLKIVGGNDQNRGAIRRRLIPVLNTTEYAATDDPSKDGIFKGNATLVTNILLGNTTGVVDARYVTAIGGGKDLENLPGIVVDIASNKADETKTVFRMVYGASEAFPLRSISYPVPVLQMMYAMQQRDITPPQLQIVFANNISAGINGLSPREVAEQTKLFVDTEREYLKRFFPELFDRVVFLQDKPMEEGGELKNLWTSLTTAVDERLDPKLKKRLLEKGSNPSKENLAYGAAHLLFHDLATQGLVVPYDDYNSAVMIEPQTALSVGGIQMIWMVNTHLSFLGIEHCSY
jgi:hypothetical protein